MFELNYDQDTIIIKAGGTYTVIHDGYEHDQVFDSMGEAAEYLADLE